jgi:nuclear transport factor 2 (NTF2) superfamily protein
VTAEETIRELIGAWQANDALRASAFFAPDARYHESGREPIAGRAAIAEHFTRFFRDGPLWRFTVEELLVVRERAAVRYVFGVKGDGGAWHERAGCAWIVLRGGLVELWREYQG